MVSVGVRCVNQVPSTREPNSYFEEEMALSFGEEKSVDTHFCQWLVSFFCIRPSQVIFQPCALTGLG